MPIVSDKFTKSMPILFCQGPKGCSFVLVRARWRYKICQENLRASGQLQKNAALHCLATSFLLYPQQNFKLKYKINDSAEKNKKPSEVSKLAKTHPYMLK